MLDHRGPMVAPVIIAPRVNQAPGPSLSPLDSSRYLPAPVHPVPLLRVAQYQNLEHRVVGASVAPDFLVDIVAFDQRQRFLEAEYVRAVGFAPARGRHDRGAGGQRHDRQALERAGRMAEEVDRYAFRRRCVLVERKHDQVAGLEPREDRVERASLAQDTEPSVAETPGHQRVEPAWPDGAADEMKAATHLRKVAQPGDGCDLEIAEVPGKDQHALAARERARQ